MIDWRIWMIVIALHIGISLLFFGLGIIMRYSARPGMLLFFYKRISLLSSKDYNETEIRRFVGETSVRLGGIPFLIAMVELFEPASGVSAVLAGWLCFIVVAVGSFTFMEKTNIFSRIKRKTPHVR
jgi:hypothetical protein